MDIPTLKFLQHMLGGVVPVVFAIGQDWPYQGRDETKSFLYEVNMFVCWFVK